MDCSGYLTDKVCDQKLSSIGEALTVVQHTLSMSDITGQGSISVQMHQL